MTSLYRRHRPQSFEEVVGQEHVVRTLRNAVEQDKVHHAYLFVGSRGTGKTSMAKILARSLNCRNGPTISPCGECQPCRSIAEGGSLDVIEMDAASNRSVDDIRELRDRVGYVAAEGSWKVYILDEAHMLTKEAWNAFLKTLEEPPPQTVFVLATTEAHKVMPTIVDRCQRFDFQRPTLDQIAEVLRRVAVSESITIDDPTVSMIARSATGSFRDALGTLDQLVSYGGAEVALDDALELLGIADAELLFGVIDAMISADAAAALGVVDRLARSGRDLTQFSRDLVAHVRHLLVVSATGEVPDTFSVTASQDGRLRDQAGRASERALVRAIDELSAAIAAVKDGGDQRVMLEVALMKIARPRTSASLESILDRLDRLEGGQPTAPTAGSEPAPAQPAAATPAPAPTPAPEPSTPPTPAPTPVSQPTPHPPAADQDVSGEAEAADDAPSPEPSEAPVPAAANGHDPQQSAVDLNRMRELWPAVTDHLQQLGSMVLSALFEGARPVSIEEGTLTIGFPSNAPFNKKKAEDRVNRERLGEALRAVTGVALTPTFVLLDGDDAGDQVETAEPLDGDELIERIKAEFDAEELIDDA